MSNLTTKTDDIIEVIIVSDNHGNKNGLKKVIEQYHEETNYFLHCGDSTFPFDDELMAKFKTVRGNCDNDDRYKLVQEIEILETKDKIVMVHGNRQEVNYGTDQLIDEFKKKEPTILLYGHTHKVDVKMRDKILIINPGSIFAPRAGNIRTYAKLKIRPDNYNVEILDINDHAIVKEFQFLR